MEKPSRPVRNRRHSRRPWPPGDCHRMVKRLFTPEIKRMLKDWLVRRRENPYPSRDEKKTLAYETGLTYTQICNWFANWRRKLKNSEREALKKSWGHLIKNYNTKAKGNVEQFSICSGDSIWEEGGENASRLSDSDMYDSDYADEKDSDELKVGGNNNSEAAFNHNQAYMPGFYVESDRKYKSDRDYPPLEYNASQTQGLRPQALHSAGPAGWSSNTKYKQHMMEKYLRDTSSATTSPSSSQTSSPELSKWLESAAKFTPEKSNYYIEWNNQRPAQVTSKKCTKGSSEHIYETIHQKEEIDAAEALANLAFNCRRRMMTSGP